MKQWVLILCLLGNLCVAADTIPPENPWWVRRARRVMTRPEVILGSVCAVAILSFSAGRMWDREAPPRRLTDPVEQRQIETREAPEVQQSSEDAAEAIGSLLKPDLK